LITPVFDAPLLLVEGDERVLVAADLHLGLEHELWLGGVSIPSQTEKILARLLGFLAEIKPDRLLLLGDIKHNVPKTSWQEKREIPEFLRRLCARAIVEIVPGNHDSNLADMAPLGVRAALLELLGDDVSPVNRHNGNSMLKGNIKLVVAS
jgi:hypothetical protein